MGAYCCIGSRFEYSTPGRYEKNLTSPKGDVRFFGAADRGRTGTDFTPRDFKSLHIIGIYYTGVEFSARRNIECFREKMKKVRFSTIIVGESQNLSSCKFYCNLAVIVHF